MSNKFLEALKSDHNKKRKPKPLTIKVEGKYTLRFLADKHDPDNVPYYKVFLHFNFFHPNYNNPGTFRCMGKDCPLCEYAKKKIAARDPEAWKYKSNIMFLYYVTDSKENFYYLRLSATAHTAVFNAITAKAKGNVNPTDLNNGRLAQFALSKLDGKHKYYCNFLNDIHKVSENISHELDMAPELKDLYHNYTKDDLEKIVRGEKLVYNYDSEEAQNSKEETKGPAVTKLYDVEDLETMSKVTKLEEAKRKIKQGLGE
jgi:hypothetical protein